MVQEEKARLRPDRAEEANQFDFTAPISVSYSRTSISGKPLLSYRDAEREGSFSGEEITRQMTAMGELVTVTIDRVVDAFDVYFTLLLPTVRLVDNEEVAFETVALETTDRSQAFVRPPGPVGALQTSRVHQLSGVAQLRVS